MYDDFSQSLNECQKELRTNKSIFDINLNIENILWNDIQRHPRFPRSISFVFLHKTTFESSNPNFEKRFLYELNLNKTQEYIYSLDRKGDSKEFYRTLLKVYHEEVDSQIYYKLFYLKSMGIKFNNHFTEILMQCARE